jgi:hypothetical protein
MKKKIKSKNRFSKIHLKKLSHARINGYIDKIVNGKKLCTKCNKILDIKNFHKQTRRTNKLQLWCKQCDKDEKKRTYHEYRKKQVRLSSKKSQLKSNYGLSFEEYKQLLKKQNNVCAICGKKQLNKNNQFNKKVLSIDHCHKTKIVRGLLCTECNFGLSKFKDDIELMKKAIKYLKKYEQPNKKQRTQV